MDREEFGRLLAALRKQTVDPLSGRSWSQRELAQMIGVSETTIGNLERGMKAHLEPELLHQLAAAFSLTPLETQEFLLAAGGVAPLPTAPQPTAILHELVEHLRETHMPACVYDPLGNVVAANRVLLALCTDGEVALSGNHASTLKFHYLPYILDAQSPLRRTNERAWRRQATYAVMHFRTTALSYRHTPIFWEIFGALQGYLDFQSIWMELTYALQKGYCQCGGFCYRHPYLGMIDYSAQTTTAITGAGKLYLTTLVPCSSNTTNIFNRLANIRESGVVALATWP